MLIGFKAKNFKSFGDELVFSMRPAPKQKGLDYSVIVEKIRGKNEKALSSSVIYGPNAAGKTNVISAMDVFRSIVLRGNIRNPGESVGIDVAVSNLELIPNSYRDKTMPVCFEIEFVEKGIKFKYSISMELGNFMDIEFERFIVEECFYTNDEMTFVRTDTVQIGDLKKLSKYADFPENGNEDVLQNMSNKSLSSTELFLTNGFKNIYSPELAKMVTDWFNDKFMVIFRVDRMELIRRYSDPKSPSVYIEKTTNDAAKRFGVTTNDVGYVVMDEGGEARLSSIFRNHMKDEKYLAIAADVYESYGTVRFLNTFPLVVKAIMTGATLVVDEFDASIHPMALINIINLFHNDDINVHHAQLVFNTQNPVFLNSNIFRRDEIKFVEKNENTEFSEVYALSDFKTSGESGVRKGSEYMKNYFIGKYGAIKNVDFAPVFEDLSTMEDA